MKSVVFKNVFAKNKQVQLTTRSKKPRQKKMDGSYINIMQGFIIGVFANTQRR
jgi:hypothetical protein